MITDCLQRLGEYLPGERWKKVAALLATMNADTPDGEYPIDGTDAYARVMSYDTLPAAGRNPEAHRDYIDLQMTLRGCEGIVIYVTDGMSVAQEYDPKRDLVFLDAASAKPVADIYNRPGYFAVLFPQDAHLPKVQFAGEAPSVKKVVVKVRIA